MFSFSLHNSVIIATGMVFTINVIAEGVFLLMSDDLCCPKTIFRGLKSEMLPCL